MFLHRELRKAREEAGLTQAELAELAGVTRNQIIRAEKGGNITIDTLQKIVAQLPVTSLTLMANVQLTADLLPARAKVYFSSMAALIHATEMVGAILKVTMEARIAMEIAMKMDPLAKMAGVEGLPPHDLEVLESLHSWYGEIQQAIHGAGKTNVDPDGSPDEAG